jgi:hypothetical protein
MIVYVIVPTINEKKKKKIKGNQVGPKKLIDRNTAQNSKNELAGSSKNILGKNGPARKSSKIQFVDNSVNKDLLNKKEGGNFDGAAENIPEVNLIENGEQKLKPSTSSGERIVNSKVNFMQQSGMQNPITIEDPSTGGYKLDKENGAGKDGNSDSEDSIGAEIEAQISGTQSPKLRQRSNRRKTTLTQLLGKIVDTEDPNDHRKFTLKCIIHAFSDITQNLAVFTLILTINFILRMIKSEVPKLPSRLVTNVAIWTASELVIDVFVLFLAMNLYKNWWFVEKVGIIKKEWNEWMGKVKEFLFIGVAGVAFLVFYILFFVVLSN